MTSLSRILGGKRLVLCLIGGSCDANRPVECGVEGRDASQFLYAGVRLEAVGTIANYDYVPRRVAAGWLNPIQRGAIVRPALTLRSEQRDAQDRTVGGDHNVFQSDRERHPCTERPSPGVRVQGIPRVLPSGYPPRFRRSRLSLRAGRGGHTLPPLLRWRRRRSHRLLLRTQAAPPSETRREH